MLMLTLLKLILDKSCYQKVLLIKSITQTYYENSAALFLFE